MPWTRLRANKPGAGLRRHSVLNPSELIHDGHLPPNLGSSQLEINSTLGSSPQNRHSVMSLDGVEPTLERSCSPPAHEQTPKHQRFSILRFKHASDSRLSATAKEHANSAAPPMPPTPAIITTAPDGLEPPQRRKPTFTLPRRNKAADTPGSLSSKAPRKSFSDRTSTWTRRTGGSLGGGNSVRNSRIALDDTEKGAQAAAPPPYGDESNTALAIPVARLSESSKSDRSSGDHGVYATTTTTTHTVSTTTTFFRLPGRKKNKGPLFPLPVRVPPPDSFLNPAATPRASTSGRPSDSPNRESFSQTPPVTAVRRPFFDYGLPSPLPSPSHTALAATSMNFAGPGSPALPRADSAASARSARSSPALPPMRLGRRGRSSTMGSLSQPADNDPLPTPPLPHSGRTSTSTSGRASLGGLFNLARLRQNSEPAFLRHGSIQVGTPGTPGTPGSKQNSFSLSRDTFVVPERQEGDTPAKYLVRLEEAVSRGAVAITLSKSDDEFSKNVLRSYMRGFKFFGDPLDMAIRKLLMEVELPKETQQIDRVLQSFADRYHECNPGIYASPDEAYFFSFSILILHTDVFNKNNKHKMQKQDYTKNAKGQGVADEILECFYDNISYTPFIHVEDDMDINGERILAPKSRKTMFKGSASTDNLRKISKEPVDPYTLILDNKLDTLRPSLKDVMNLEDSYSYLGTATSLNLAELQRTFFKSGVLQILSSRSRPEAFMSPATITNPAEAHPGVVDIKVTKVGILWRKDSKKKKARSPWQEWGAVLTGSQLYFFRNTTWIRNMVHQHDSHHKAGLANSPVIFKPPLERFSPDALMSTEDAVALQDSTYKKHKNAFMFVRHGGLEETFLADSENDMNDWLAKLNYAAAFRTAGVRMRGVVATSYEGPRTKGLRRLDSSTSTRSVQTSTGEVTIQSGRLDTELAQQILAARRQIMLQRIEDADEKISVANKKLDDLLRNGRHLQILAPIQNKTREQVILAAGRMAAKVQWVRRDIWRMRCHKDVLALDLEEELRSGNERQTRTEELSAMASKGASSPSQNREGLSRLTSKASNVFHPQVRQISSNTLRPATQPSGQKAFSVEDIFQTPTRVSDQSGNHRPQSSWELPPLTFQPTNSSGGSGSGANLSVPRHNLSHKPSATSVKSSAAQAGLKDIVTRLATPTPSLKDNESEVLKEAGLVTETTMSEGKRPDTASDAEERDSVQTRSPEHDFTDGRSKVRRSLHRTLRDAHVPTHHRSKKGRDSASSAALAEDSHSTLESEGLARGTGSFTVHGKKASVITFGSEWQNMSPEERVKLRKQAQAQGDDSRILEPAAVEDEGMSVATAPVADAGLPCALGGNAPAERWARRDGSVASRLTLSTLSTTDDGGVSLRDH